MNPEQPFRAIMIAGSLILLPIMIYHRVRSQLTGEKLDRLQEGYFMLFTLRPIGLASMIGVFTYMVNPQRMAWSSMALPAWLRWVGVGLGAIAGVLLVWTLVNLGKNLTDTVVTRRVHTLVTRGPYRWVRHPFYDSVLLLVFANGLTAANWFILTGGVLVFALMFMRARREEELLLARFGDPYRAYVARTGRFLPRIG